MTSPARRKGTPITRTQNEVVTRLRAVLDAKQHDDDEFRDRALVHLLDKKHAEQLMDRTVQGDNAVDTLLAGYPDTPPTRELLQKLIVEDSPAPQLSITAGRILDRAWNVRQDLLLLSEYAWALGRDGLDTAIADDATQAVHAAFTAVARFHKAYGLPLPGEEDGQMHPALAAAVDAVQDED